MIGIIGVLVGMLLPAIQSARESARRSQCSNKLKQIGIALAGFEATAGRYPAGVASDVWKSESRDDTALDDRAAHGFYYWTTFLHLLLPRLDEQTYYDGLGGPLFRRLPFERYDPVPAVTMYRQVNGVPLPPLLCPSDTEVGTTWWSPPGLDKARPPGMIKVAKSNYLGFFSGTSVAESLAFLDPDDPGPRYPHETRIHPLPPRAAWFFGNTTATGPTITDRRAMFGYGAGTPLQAVRDGTAYTIAVAEYLRGVSDQDGRGAFWHNDAGMQSLQATTTPNSPTPDVLHNGRRIMSLAWPTMDWGCDGATSPNNQPRRNLPCRGGSQNNFLNQGLDCFAASRSRHRGGVNVLFVDGRVSFINDSIDGSTTSPYGTWQRLVWIDDGNPVGEW